MAKATATTTAFGNASLVAAQKHSSAFTSVGIAGIAIAGGLGFAMKAAADAAISFESTFAGVRKTVDATEAEFEVLAQGIRDMSKEIPVSVEELNKIAETAGQLGVAKEDILGFTRVIADMGATTNLVGDEAATAFARIANIMQMPQDQFEQLGSTVVALGNAGASTESEITDFALRIAGAGKIAGLATSDILGIANAFSSVGIESEAGGTAVQKVLIGITQAVATGSPKLEQFAAAAGMSADQFATAWATDPIQAFTAFVEGLGASGNQAMQILADLGLTDQRLIRSFLSLSGAGDTLRTSVDLGTAAWEENSALAEEAGKRYETTASKVAIAGNKINDAAISFGALMLPAIAAVMGALGDFADLIGGLPGPVRAVVLVVGAAAAAMALLGGATLLLLPRLALVKAAMVDAGIKGGLFRGSLKMIAGAINPVTVGLTALTLVVGAYASAKAEARQRTEEFISALEADTGALGVNTSAALANQLQAEDLLETFKSMGQDTEAVTADVLAMADGSDAAKARIEDLLASMSVEDAIAFGGIISGLGISMKELENTTKAAGNATDEVGDAATAATPPVDDLGTAFDETASLADNLTKALEDLAGTALDAEESNLAWLNSIAALRTELKHGAKTLDINTQAGRDNRQAILDSVDAAIAHGAAVAEETGSLKKGAKATADHIAALITEAEKAGLSKDEIHDYIGELNLTPKEIKTAIVLLGVDHAKVQLFGLNTMLDTFASVWTAVVKTVTDGSPPSQPHGVDHAGGVIGASGARRLHAGGNIRGDEEMFIGQRGERVLSVREWNALRSITGSGATAPHASKAASGDRVVKVFVRADRRHFTDELDHDVTYAGRWAS